MTSALVTVSICLFIAVVIDVFLLTRIAVLKKMLSFFDSKLKAIEEHLSAYKQQQESKK